jgi:hypothetical protein
VVSAFAIPRWVRRGNVFAGLCLVLVSSWFFYVLSYLIYLDESSSLSLSYDSFIAAKSTI